MQKRPWRVPLARHIDLTEVALDFSRVTAEFCMSERSPDQLIRILHISCPPEVLIWAVHLNTSTLYIGISANATCPCPRESFSARKVDVPRRLVIGTPQQEVRALSALEPRLLHQRPHRNDQFKILLEHIDHCSAVEVLSYMTHYYSCSAQDFTPRNPPGSYHEFRFRLPRSALHQPPTTDDV